MKRMGKFSSIFAYLIALNIAMGSAIFLMEDSNNSTEAAKTATYSEEISTNASTTNMLTFSMGNLIWATRESAAFNYTIYPNSINVTYTVEEIKNILTGMYLEVYETSESTATLISEPIDIDSITTDGLNTTKQIDLSSLPDPTKTYFYDIKWSEKGMAAGEYYYSNRPSFTFPGLSYPKISYSQEYTGVHQVEEKMFIDFSEDTSTYALSDIFSNFTVLSKNTSQSTNILLADSDNEKFSVEHVDNQDFIVEYWATDLKENSKDAETLTYSYQWKYSTFGGNDKVENEVKLNTRERYSAVPNVEINSTISDAMTDVTDWTTVLVDFVISNPTSGEWMFNDYEGSKTIPSFFELNLDNLIDEIVIYQKGGGYEISQQPSDLNGKFEIKNLEAQKEYDFVFEIHWKDNNGSPIMAKDFSKEFTFNTKDKLEHPELLVEGSAPTEIDFSNPRDYFTQYNFTFDLTGKDVTRAITDKGEILNKDNAIRYEVTEVDTGSVVNSGNLTYDAAFNKGLTITDLKPGTDYSVTFTSNYSDDAKLIYNKDIDVVNKTFTTNKQLSAPIINNIAFTELNNGLEQDWTQMNVDFDIEATNPSISFNEGDANYVSLSTFINQVKLSYYPESNSSDISEVSFDFEEGTHFSTTLTDIVPNETYNYTISASYTDLGKVIFSTSSDLNASGSFGSKAKMSEPIIVIKSSKPASIDAPDLYTTQKINFEVQSSAFDIVNGDSSTFMSTEYLFSEAKINYWIDGGEVSTQAIDLVEGIEGNIEQSVTLINLKPGQKYNYSIELKYNPNVIENVIMDADNNGVVKIEGQTFTTTSKILAPTVTLIADPSTIQLESGTIDKYNATLDKAISWPTTDGKDEYITDIRATITNISNGEIFGDWNNKSIIGYGSSIPLEGLDANTTYEVKVSTDVENFVEKPIDRSTTFTTKGKIAPTESDYSIRWDGINPDNLINGQYSNVKAVLSLHDIVDSGVRENITKVSLMKENVLIDSKENPFMSSNEVSFNLNEPVYPGAVLSGYKFKIDTPDCDVKSLIINIPEASLEFVPQLEATFVGYDRLKLNLSWTNLSTDFMNTYTVKLYSQKFNKEYAPTSDGSFTPTNENDSKEFEFTGLEEDTNYTFRLVNIESGVETIKWDSAKWLPPFKTNAKEFKYNADITDVVIEDDKLESFKYSWVNNYSNEVNRRNIKELNVSILEPSSGKETTFALNQLSDLQIINSPTGTFTFSAGKDWTNDIGIGPRAANTKLDIEVNAVTEHQEAIDSYYTYTTTETVVSDSIKTKVSVNNWNEIIGGNLDLDLKIENYDQWGTNKIKINFYESVNGSWEDLNVINNDTYNNVFIFDSGDATPKENYEAALKTKFHGIKTTNDIKIKITFDDQEIVKNITHSEISGSNLIDPNSFAVIETAESDSYNKTIYRIKASASDELDFENQVTFTNVIEEGDEIKETTDIQVMSNFDAKQKFDIDSSNRDLFIEVNNKLCEDLSPTDLSFLVGRYILIDGVSTKSIDWANTQAYYIEDFDVLPVPMSPWAISFFVLFPIVLIALLIFFIWFKFNKERRYEHIKELAEDSYEKMVNQINNYSWNEKYDEYVRLSEMKKPQLLKEAKELELEFHEDITKDELVEKLSLLTPAEIERAKSQFVEYELEDKELDKQNIPSEDDKFTKAIFLYQTQKEKLTTWVNEKKNAKKNEQLELDRKNQEAIAKAKAALKQTKDKTEDGDEDE